MIKNKKIVGNSEEAKKIDIKGKQTNFNINVNLKIKKQLKFGEVNIDVDNNGNCYINKSDAPGIVIELSKAEIRLIWLATLRGG